MAPNWPTLNPEQAFTMERRVQASEIDGFGHVNNAVYLAWLDECAWVHAEALGVGLSFALKQGEGFAVAEATLSYLGSARIDDHVEILTWIVGNDGRNKGLRVFEVWRDTKLILRARIKYTCINLATLKPTRMSERYHLLFPAFDPPASCR